MTNSRRKFLRRPAVIVFGLILTPFLALATLFFAELWELHKHGRVSEDMRLAIMRLAFHPPDDVTERQWAFCIARAHIFHGNYGTHPSYVPTADLRRICAELNDHIDRGPTLGTIDWIWDQYIAAYPRAANLEGYRPTAEHNWNDIPHHSYGEHDSLSQWRKDYEGLSARLGTR